MKKISVIIGLLLLFILISCWKIENEKDDNWNIEEFAEEANCEFIKWENFHSIHSVTYWWYGEDLKYIGEKYLDTVYGSMGDFHHTTKKYLVKDHKIKKFTLWKSLKSNKYNWLKSWDNDSFVLEKDNIFQTPDGKNLFEKVDWTYDYIARGKKYERKKTDYFKNSVKIWNFQSSYLFQYFDKTWNYIFRTKQSDKEYAIVWNWVEWDLYSTAPDLTISEDGSRYAYLAKKRYKWYLVIDWEVAELEWDYDPFYKGENFMAFSDDWKHFAYKKNSNQGSSIVHNWVEWKTYKKIVELDFSPNNNLVYIASDWEAYFVVQNGVEWKKYKYISDIAFIPRLAFLSNWDLVYWAGDEEYSYIVENWKEVKKFDHWIYKIVFWPDLNRYSVITKDTNSDYWDNKILWERKCN